MAKKNSPVEAVLQMAAEIAGIPQRTDSPYVGKKIWTRKTKGERRQCGTVTGTMRCSMAGCNGRRLNVLWKDGHRTRPCSKGCGTRDNGDLEIL